ncbi:hypothetical protein BpHYR1_035453 [Brachionus plicatilis]|uniref:Uncharacterized protein n=1 Tax=Brachionus plicatilis TaxID=10195 RepID=A0A3M7SRD3_BRAPC|nr:hypothetical protein BpHYR1_035453 [Brachionus plicatilis]
MDFNLGSDFFFKCHSKTTQEYKIPEAQLYMRVTRHLVLISKYFKIETSKISINLISNDGISDLIWLCLCNLKLKHYRTLLNELIQIVA